MTKNLTKQSAAKRKVRIEGYKGFSAEIAGLLESARCSVARTTNSIITATYWEIGRRIVEFEQQGRSRAGYGKQLIEKLSTDLTLRFGRVFGVVNLSHMRKFYNGWPSNQIFQTVSEKLQSESEEITLKAINYEYRISNIELRITNI